MPTFRTRRYLIALLWHWTIPFFLGVATGGVLLAIQLVQTLPEIEQVLTNSIAAACN